MRKFKEKLRLSTVMKNSLRDENDGEGSRGVRNPGFVMASIMNEPLLS